MSKVKIEIEKETDMRRENEVTRVLVFSPPPPPDKRPSIYKEKIISERVVLFFLWKFKKLNVIVNV